jgi:hypothetical protein
MPTASRELASVRMPVKPLPVSWEKLRSNETPMLSSETQLAAGIDSPNLVASDWSPDGR